MISKPYGKLCTSCKGYKRLCRLDTCPVLDRIRSHIKIYRRIDSLEASGSTPPSLLVGEYGYPKVRVMLNIPPGIYGGEAKIYDAPEAWWGRYSLDEIIRLRSSLLASTLRVNVGDPWRLYELEVNISAVSSAPVDTEVYLEDKPIPRIDFDGLTKPIALRADAKSIRVTSSPRLGGLMERMITDDIKASDAIIELYNAGYSIYTLIHALSGGLLGQLRYRRLVPTRWAITAVDNTLGNYFRRGISRSDTINEVEAYSSEYLGNKFIIIMAPGPLQLEWIEGWHQGSLWSGMEGEPTLFRVLEDVRGRYDYMDGGFIAARLPVLEHLYRIGRQATIFIYREISPSYYAPVGNWHIRETVRRALERGARKYSSLGEALREELKYFSIPMDRWLRASRLVKDLMYQARIDDYI